MTRLLWRGPAVAIAILAVTARAEDPTARGFDADSAHPALGITRGIVVETATGDGAGSWAAGLRLDWLQGFLALTVDGRRDQLLESRLTGHLMAARAFRWFELGVDVPVVIYQRADFHLLTDLGGTGPLVDPVASSALGPVRLDAQLGYVFRGQGQYAQLVVHDAFAWGVAASTALPAVGPLKTWRAHAELVGGVPRGY